MSSEDFHQDLISRLDPETVAKAMERYTKKPSTGGVYKENENKSNISSKVVDSSASTPTILPKLQKNSTPPRNQKQSVTIPVDQYLYAKYPTNYPEPMWQRGLKEGLHRSRSASSFGSIAATSPLPSPYLRKKDSSDIELQVARNILTDVEFDMESLASGIESEPANANMKGIDEWIHGAGKRKKRMSKRDRKKSSTHGMHPPVGVVEPRTILSHLDNALDIAEMHKGQGAILKKVSVVTKPKVKSGYINNGFSGRLSGNGSSDNLSEDHTPDSSLHGAVFPNKRKQSLAKAFINKALPNRKKKSETEKVIMFKFQNPNLQYENAQHLDHQVPQSKLKLEAGEALKEVSDVDSIRSVTDTDDEEIDSDHAKRIRSKYKEKLEQRRNTMQSVKSVVSHTTLVDEQMYNDKQLPKISVSETNDHQRYLSINEVHEDYGVSLKIKQATSEFQKNIAEEQETKNAEAYEKNISQITMDSVHTLVAVEDQDYKSQTFPENDAVESNLRKQNSLPDYNEVFQSGRKHDGTQAKIEYVSESSGKNTLTHKDSSNFLTVSNKKLSTSLTVDNDDDWDRRSIRSIRSFVSQNMPGSPGGVTSSASDAAIEQQKRVHKEEEAKIERRERFWDYFTFIGSMVWAMLIIVVGCVLYAQDIFVHGHKRGSHRTQYYNMCLCILGTAIFITLIVDINKYTTMMKKYWQKGAEPPDIELVEGEDGELMISITVSEAPKKLPQYYGFTTGRSEYKQ